MEYSQGMVDGVRILDCWTVESLMMMYCVLCCLVMLSKWREGGREGGVWKGRGVWCVCGVWCAVEAGGLIFLQCRTSLPKVTNSPSAGGIERGRNRPRAGKGPARSRPEPMGRANMRTSSHQVSSLQSLYGKIHGEGPPDCSRAPVEFSKWPSSRNIFIFDSNNNISSNFYFVPFFFHSLPGPCLFPLFFFPFLHLFLIYPNPAGQQHVTLGLVVTASQWIPSSMDDH